MWLKDTAFVTKLHHFLQFIIFTYSANCKQIYNAALRGDRGTLQKTLIVLQLYMIGQKISAQNHVGQLFHFCDMKYQLWKLLDCINKIPSSRC